MIEVGRTYEFHSVEVTARGAAQVQMVRRVVAVDGPLVRIEGGEILNLHSALFERAVDVEERRRWLDGVRADLGPVPAAR